MGPDERGHVREVWIEGLSVEREYCDLCSTTERAGGKEFSLLIHLDPLDIKVIHDYVVLPDLHNLCHQINEQGHDAPFPEGVVL